MFLNEEESLANYCLNGLHFHKWVVSQYKFCSHILNVIKWYSVFPLEIGISTAAVVVHIDTHYL